MAVRIRPIFFDRYFMLGMNVITSLQSRANIVTSSGIGTLIPPIKGVLQFIIFDYISDGEQERHRCHANYRWYFFRVCTAI